MRRVAVGVIVLALLVFGVPAVLAQVQACAVVDDSTEEVIPGVILTWDSSFLCDDAPDEGSYEFTVQVSNDPGSAEAVRIGDLKLTHTTPCPRGGCPDATGEAQGLPITAAPGETDSFTVSGTYELVETDEGKKANLHFLAHGDGVSSGEPFDLGINAHFRAPGVSDGSGGADREASEGAEGTPDWVPGPPPWITKDAAAAATEKVDHGPPSWVPGPPPWVKRAVSPSR